MVAEVVFTCVDCGVEKPVAHFTGSPQRPGAPPPCCRGCSALRGEKKMAADLEERRRVKAERDAAKRLKAQERQAAKDRAKAKLKAEKEKAEAAAKLVANSRKYMKRERTKVNIAQRELYAREVARRHLMPFVVRMKPNYLAGWVHKDICARLEKFSADVAAGKSPRLILMLPPRIGKSELGSIQFPAWHLGKHPDHEVISCSHTSGLAEKFSRQVREQLRNPVYQSIFDTRLDPDQQNATGWRTTRGGGLLPAGVGGGIVGNGAHVLVIDDPVKNATEAESETSREGVWEWYTTSAYSRLAPGGGVLVIMQRWHDDDLSGRLERYGALGEGDVFEVVRYPMEAEEDEIYRLKGDPLHPARYDKEACERIKRVVPPRVWAALYQQNPVATDGEYFTRQMLKWFIGPPPRGLHVYAAFDFAIGKGERNDYTVGVVVGIDEDENMYLLDMRRGRWDSFEIVHQILDVHKVWSPRAIGVEHGQIKMAIGPFLEQRISEERLYDINIQELKTGKRDKEMRARAIQGRMHQHKVLFPKDAAWEVDDLINELLRFPGGVHDDAVDALAWIGLMLQEMDPPTPGGSTPGRVHSWKTKLAKLGRRGSASRRNPMAA